LKTAQRRRNKAKASRKVLVAQIRSSYKEHTVDA
jgi:hypothetical protein